MFSGDATANVGLPQWQGGDHPSWLEDMNPAFRKIDSTFGELTGMAGEASKLIKEIIPQVEEATEKLSALDVREESDRAYLQQQVDGLKNADTYLQGLIDALEASKGDMENAIKALDGRVTEEELTTAGFSSAAGNTILARYQVLQHDLEEDVANLTALREDFQDHVSDFNTKYRDLADRMIDTEGDVRTLKNRVQALEDWKSPFSQQVDNLEKQFGMVTTEVVDITKRLDLLQNALTVLDSEVHEIRQVDREQNKRLDDIVKQQGEDHSQIQENKANIGVMKQELDSLDMRMEAVEGSTAEHGTAIANLEEAVAENEKSIGEVNLALQEHVQESNSSFAVITDRLNKHDTEMHDIRTDLAALQNKVEDLEMEDMGIIYKDFRIANPMTMDLFSRGLGVGSAVHEDVTAPGQNFDNTILRNAAVEVIKTKEVPTDGLAIYTATAVSKVRLLYDRTNLRIVNAIAFCYVLDAFKNNAHDVTGIFDFEYDHTFVIADEDMELWKTLHDVNKTSIWPTPGILYRRSNVNLSPEGESWIYASRMISDNIAFRLYNNGVNMNLSGHYYTESTSNQSYMVRDNWFGLGQ